MANDTYDVPKRVDTSGRLSDRGFYFLKSGQTPTRFLGKTDGGESAASNPLTAVASVVVTTGTTTASVAFTNQTAADQYVAQYWNNNTPNTKLEIKGTGTPIVLAPLTSGASYKVRVRAEMAYDDGSWLESDWSSAAGTSFTQS